MVLSLEINQIPALKLLEVVLPEIVLPVVFTNKIPASASLPFSVLFVMVLLLLLTVINPDEEGSPAVEGWLKPLLELSFPSKVIDPESMPTTP